MEDHDIRAALDRHWAASDANDFEAEHQIYREDAVLEYPQSGERIRGPTKTALGVGFRHFDCSERYRNEQAVGDAMQEMFKAGTIQRKDVFVTTKLWNNNHRPERVKPAFEASRHRLRLDYVDSYLVHTPFAFQPGDE